MKWKGTKGGTQLGLDPVPLLFIADLPPPTSFWRPEIGGIYSVREVATRGTVSFVLVACGPFLSNGFICGRIVCC